VQPLLEPVVAAGQDDRGAPLGPRMDPHLGDDGRDQIGRDVVLGQLVTKGNSDSQKRRWRLAHRILPLM
jgi:hypothetical protein